MIRIDCQQGTPEWFQHRCGCLTGSNAAKVPAKGKGKDEAVVRRDLRFKLLAEILTGQPQEDDFPKSKAMEHGTDTEPEARYAYEAHTGNIVEQVGFLRHDSLRAGCSPDGLIGHDGILEIKCPKTATHIAYRDNPASLVDAYRHQIIHNLWIAQRSWCDLVSFDDRLPDHLRLVIVRYDAHTPANTAEIASYELLARQFLSEVDAAVAKYTAAPVQEVA